MKNKLQAILLLTALASTSSQASFKEGLTEMANGNIADGVALIKTAATDGDMYAQFNLGDLYYRGVAGVEKNKDLAVGWIKKSADQGYDIAEAQLISIGLIDSKKQ